MAVKKTTGKSDRAESAVFNRTVFRRILFGLLILAAAAVAAGIIWMICQLPDVLMFKNERFKFKHAEIQSTGYWKKQGKEQELLERIGLNKDINLFEVNVGDIRKKVLAIGNIRDAEVQIMLPDMIIFRLAERIPLANVGGDEVIDEYGRKFKRSESAASDRVLPIILGCRDDRADKVKEALKLIATANRNCQAVTIKRVLVSQYEYLDVFLTYRGRDLRVKFPLNKDYGDLFNKLQSAVLHTYLNRENPVGFDLRFRDYTIPEYAPGN